ncbi:MAG: hypothetical protein HOP97_01735, partial [Terrabacter sp.]|nr:hypothetical protein [Terrabacter sp.]
MTTRRHPLLVTALSLALAAATTLGLASTGPAAAAPSSQLPPPVGHVFVITLETTGFDETWGPSS